VGSRTYSVTVTNANKCTSAAKSGTITVHGIPTINHASGSTNQTVNSGTAITAIKYNTANATGASLTDQPTGVSGSWTSDVYTISGTPSNTGTFTFTAAATHTNGCIGTTASGTITVTQSCTNCQSWTTCSSTSGYQYNSTYGNNYYYYTGSSRIQDGKRNGFTMISNVSHETNQVMDWKTASTYCINKGDGWRMPTLNELYCMRENKSTLPGAWQCCFYWSATQNEKYADYCYIVNFNNSNITHNIDTIGYNLKCVK
jgi:hypothetical protein